MVRRRSTPANLHAMKYVPFKLLLAPLLFLFYSITAGAQSHSRREAVRLSAEQYITAYSDAAVTDMARTGVPASITLAQGMFESDYGNSPLAKDANNHFGIKCHKEWTGPTYHQDDDAPNECFRKYENVWQSYADHSEFLRTRERYASLFELSKTDYKAWAHGLKRAGYATNPHYAHRIIDLIERYDLTRFDQAGLVASRATIKPEKPAEPMRIEVAQPGAVQADASQVKSNRRSVPAVSGRDKAPVRTWKFKKTTENAPAEKSVTVASTTDASKINGVPFVLAREGDTWSKIARDQGIELWQVLDFNDAVKNDVVRPGEVVFIRSKKNKAESALVHQVKPGESLRGISQQYGVKLSRIYRMNELAPGQEPEVGSKVYLQRAMLMGVVL